MGGGGVRLYFVLFQGGGGVGVLDLNFVRRGGGSSKNWMMGQNFSRPPRHLNNERSLRYG